MDSLLSAANVIAQREYCRRHILDLLKTEKTYKEVNLETLSYFCFQNAIEQIRGNYLQQLISSTRGFYMQIQQMERTKQNACFPILNFVNVASSCLEFRSHIIFNKFPIIFAKLDFGKISPIIENVNNVEQMLVQRVAYAQENTSFDADDRSSFEEFLKKKNTKTSLLCRHCKLSATRIK